MTGRRWVFFTLVLSMIVSACATPPAPTPAPTPQADKGSGPRFESADCWFDKPQGQTVECGYLVVPEDRAKSDGKTIKLAVARFKSSDSNPASDPVVYLEGGPGASPLRGLVPQFNAIFVPFLEKRDLILVDQRGTGYSQPALDCPEYIDWQLSVLDQNLSAEQADRSSEEPILKCRERLAQSGANLAAYNSHENAADLNDLRQVLGIDQWNLYGISYGTRLALTAMRDFPQGIRSVVIDSVYPPQASLTDSPASGARAFEELFNACAADADCSAAFPDLREVFFDLVDQLNAKPVTFKVRLPAGGPADFLLNGDGLMSTIFQSLYATPIIPMLPRLIYEVRDGNTALAGVLQSFFLDQLKDLSFGMYFSVQCDEEIPFSRPADVDALVKQFPQYHSLASKGIFDVCKAWGSPPPNPVENLPVTSDVPTLVLSGQFDPVTPPAWAEETAKSLSKSFYFKLPNSGHGASLGGGDCPRSLVLAFFDNPSTQPDASCVTSEMSKMEFARPLKDLSVRLVPFSDSGMKIEGVRPEGWKAIGAGAYSPNGQITDQTAIVLQAAPIGADAFLKLMNSQIEQSDSKAKLAKVRSHTANGLDWSIYRADVQIAVVDLAVAEKSGTTYLVLMQSLADEHDKLYDVLFIPVVDALKALK